DGVPAGGEVCLESGVDDAPVVGGDGEWLTVDCDGYDGVSDRDAREAAPAANLAVVRIRAVSPGCVGLRENHSAEHPSPGGRAVAGVRNDDGCSPASDGASVAVC